MIPLRNLRRFLRKAFEQPLYAFRVGYRRLLAYAFYAFPGGKAPLPEAVTIFLTHKCNLRCKMCGQWGDKGVTRESGRETLSQELSFDEMKDLVDELSSVRSNVTLFGGEPFMYRHIIPLAEYIKSKRLHCLVITNGSLLQPVAEAAVKSGLDELNLSLDGAEGTHDDIRGVNGLFARITEGLRAVNLEKEKQGTKKPLINLQCTINQDNYLKLDELLDVARAVKANSLTFHHLIFLTGEIYARQEQHLANVLPGTRSPAWKGFVFEPGVDPARLVEKVRALKKISSGLFVNFYPNFSDEEILDYYRNPQYLPKSYAPRCVSPWIVAYVFPDGEVRPCLNVDYSFGNLRNAPLRAIWNSEKAQAYRRALKGGKIFPACIRCTELFRY
ncbi:MAG: radical SAM protein [Endomicrobiales bacterium]